MTGKLHGLPRVCHIASDFGLTAFRCSLIPGLEHSKLDERGRMRSLDWWCLSRGCAKTPPHPYVDSCR